MVYHTALLVSANIKHHHGVIKNKRFNKLYAVYPIAATPSTWVLRYYSILVSWTGIQYFHILPIPTPYFLAKSCKVLLVDFSLNNLHHVKVSTVADLGTEWFEHSTSCSQSKCATKLRHAPMVPSVGLEPTTFRLRVEHSSQLS